MKKRLTDVLKRILIILLFIILHSECLKAQHISLNTYDNQIEIKAAGSVTLTDGFYIPAGKNVRIYIGASSQNCVPYVWNVNNNQNYIRSRVFKIAGVTTENIDSVRTVCEVNQIVQYIDGLGRPLQTVTVQGSPTFRDVVQPVAYDAFGREYKEYLPYVSSLSNSDGSFKASAIANQAVFYNDPLGQSAPGVTAIPDGPFSETKFESSPINRVLEKGAPGASWQLSQGHTKRMFNESNVENDVRFYHAEPDMTDIRKRNLLNFGYYSSSQLYLTVTKDENWSSTQTVLKAGTTEEYKDKDGRVVLKRLFNEKNNEFEILSTYYVYDDLGNLCFVLPPGSNPDSGNIDQTTLDTWCFQYLYDRRQRVIEKKIPGKGREFMVYNPLDQVVFTQDANLYEQHQWLFTKYDALGRVVMTGLYADAASRDTLQRSVNDQMTINQPLWENRDNANGNGLGTGYSNQTLPIVNVLTYHSMNYYDDYNFYGNDFGGPTGNQVGGSRTKTLITGTRVNKLGSTEMYLTVNYYDEEGRVVRATAQNHLNGKDITDNTWNFAGELTASIRTHTGSAVGPVTTIATRYEYDHMGRKLATMESINGQPEVVLSKLAYNEVGQLLKKELHSTDNGVNFIQNNSYAYNERGWTSKINDLNNITAKTVFGMDLIYANKPDAFNGNIGSVSWQTKVPEGWNLAQEVQNYTYDYDKLNRLKKAGYSTSAVVDKFNEELSYDVMGNITSLKRKNALSGFLNDLSYNYTNAGVTGNKLWGVADIGSAAQSSNYDYDPNGNQKSDSRKGISITYNYLNLPQTITKASTGEAINYVYDATGRKLKKIFGSSTRDYIDGIEYSDGAIEFIQTEEGRALPGTNYTFEYMLKDHLGNTRAVVKQNGEIAQVQDYYAFGMDMNPGNAFTSTPSNQYKYNGKEKQTELGLDQLDYGARFYDPVIGRFSTIDPLADQMRRSSPYSYGFNNPIRFVDPDGMMPNDFVMGEDGIYWDKNANSQRSTKEGEKYLGKDLTFTFNSYIDGNLWDGPLGNFTSGDKLVSTVNVTGNEDSDGNLASVDIKSSYKINATGGIFQTDDYFPGQKNIALDIKGGTSGTASFEQHAKVNSFEEFGLGLLGYDKVNVAQKLTLGLSGNKLSVSAATDVFPSAKLDVNSVQLFNYEQPSFQNTHGITRTISGYRAPTSYKGGPVPAYQEKHLRPAPNFYKRY